MEQRIQAFPTLRLFKKNKAITPDYSGHRTVDDLTTYLKDHTDGNFDRRLKEAEESNTVSADVRNAQKEHPGCMVSGYILVNRVPGNFHLEARSLHHNLNAAMTNLSHVVNHLSFGTPLASSTERKL